MKFAHIINPVKVNQNSDLFIAQPITFKTMENAKKFAENFNIEIQQFYTCFEEDLSKSPKTFKQANILELSVQDYSTFNTKKKLPLIKDILDNLYNSSDADYFIYTNVDIALMPHFYINISKIIQSGIDACVINRRTINNHYTTEEEIPQMYSEIGQQHPGYDCFIFPRNKYNNFILGTTCIGANFIGKALLTNLIINSEKFRLFTNEHLTFHIGDDMSWKQSQFNDYDLHNKENFYKILQYHKDKLNKHPLLEKFKKRFLDNINE